MPGYQNRSGIWSKLTPYGKLTGSWLKAKEAWVKDAGTWKQWWLNGGLENTSFASQGNGGLDGAITLLKVAPDDGIFVGGSFNLFNGTSIASLSTFIKIASDGKSLASTFNGNLGSGFNNPVYDTVNQSDGKIIVCGFFTSLNGTTRNRLVRLNSDGTVDTSFYTNLGTSFGSVVYTAEVQSDGKILVGGNFTIFNGNTRNRLVRLNSDGTEDTAFYTNLGTGFNLSVRDIKLLSTGKIIVCGDFSTLNGTTRNRIVCLNSDGTLDTTFATNVGTAFSSGISYQNEYSRALAIQSTDKIIISGGFTTFNALTRNRIVSLNADGTQNTTFNNNVGGGNGLTWNTHYIKKQSDDKILIGGDNAPSGITSNTIFRLNSDGTHDSTFTSNVGGGTDGDGFQYPFACHLIDVQSTGKILASAKNVIGWGYYDAVTNFGDLGPGPTIFGIRNPNSNQTKTLYNFPFLHRLNSTGTYDNTFGIENTGLSSPANDLGIQSDQKVVIGGDFIMYGSNRVNSMMRFNANGTVDTTFYTNLGTGFDGKIYAIEIQSDDKIIAGGQFTALNGTTRNRLVRLNSTGTVDTAFYTNLGSGFSGGATATIKVQSDGKILVGGLFTTFNGNTRNRLVRLNSDGTLDTTFSTNIGSGFNDIVARIAVQSDGKILVGGYFTTFNGNTRNRLVRLNSDGTEDTAFYTNLGTGFNLSVRDIKVQSDGKILVGGEFTTLNAITRNRLVRLNSDGTVDTTFYTNMGTAFNNIVNCIEIQQDGKIIAGGIFSSFSGNSQYLLARLNSTGTIDSEFRNNSMNLPIASDHYVRNIKIKINGQICAVGTFRSYKTSNRTHFVQIGGD